MLRGYKQEGGLIRSECCQCHDAKHNKVVTHHLRQVTIKKAVFRAQPRENEEPFHHKGKEDRKKKYTAYISFHSASADDHIRLIDSNCKM